MASMRQIETWGAGLSAGLFVILLSVSTFASTDPFSRATSTPQAEGMDAVRIQQMMDVITEQNARTDSRDTIDSVIVIRHGNVVLEAYPNRYYPVSSTHHLFSVTKSILSLLIGIAVDRGLIASVQDPILAYFPDVVPEA